MIPAKSHFVWRDLLLGRKQASFTGLATRILLSRLMLTAKSDPSPVNISKCIDELYLFFVKNERLVQADIKVLSN